MRKKTISDRQRAANRANAAKSTGPATPEGKATAALNALKHGLHARDVVLSTESCEQFDQLRDAYYRRLKPIDYMESDLVDDIVVVRWEIRRMRCIGHSHLELEILRPNPDPDLISFSPPIHTALAHRLLANNSNVMQVGNRQLARLSREYQRLMTTFFELRRNCPPANDFAPELDANSPTAETENGKVKNEPIPISGHSDFSASASIGVYRRPNILHRSTCTAPLRGTTPPMAPSTQRHSASAHTYRPVVSRSPAP
jgi:hypothetical protein